MQIRERDAWIGWDAEAFLEAIVENPPVELITWFRKILNGAIDELFIEDFLEEQLLDLRDLKEPSSEVIARLKTHGKRHANAASPFRKPPGT